MLHSKLASDQSGRPDLNRRPLAPQECIHEAAASINVRLARPSGAQASAAKQIRALVSRTRSHLPPISEDGQLRPPDPQDVQCGAEGSSKCSPGAEHGEPVEYDPLAVPLVPFRSEATGHSREPERG